MVVVAVAGVAVEAEVWVAARALDRPVVLALLVVQPFVAWGTFVRWGVRLLAAAVDEAKLRRSHRRTGPANTTTALDALHHRAMCYQCIADVRVAFVVQLSIASLLL